MSSARRRGLGTAVAGLVVAALAIVAVRVQWLAGRPVVVVPYAAGLGAIFFAVGLFQVISGRDEQKRGLGVLGLLFVVVVGGAGMVAGFALATPVHHAPPPPPPIATDPIAPATRSMIEGLANAKAVPLPAPTAAGHVSR